MPDPHASDQSRSLHWNVDAAFMSDFDRALVPGIGMPHHTGAGIVGEHALELARRVGGAIRDDHHPRMYGPTDAYSAAVVHTHPRSPARRVEKRIENRPVRDRVRTITHGLGLAVGRGDRTRIQVVAADHDGRLDRAGADELVEANTRARTLAIAKPADSRRQALELHLLTGRLDPAHQRGVVGELLDHGAVGDGNVLRVARQRNPAKGSFAFAEQWTDVGGHEAWELERARAAAQLRLGTQAVAVIENLGAVVEEVDHRVDVARHALSRAANVFTGVVEPQLLRVLDAEPDGDVAHRVVRGRLVGDDIDLE